MMYIIPGVQFNTKGNLIMQKSIIVLVAVAASAMSQASMAEAPNKVENVMDHVPSGVYVEGTLGYSSTGSGFSNSYTLDPAGYAQPEIFRTDMSNGGLGYNVSLGYQFLNNVGIEVGATQYASRSGSVDMAHYDHMHSNVGSVETKNSRMYDVAGRFSMPVGEDVDVFAKVGLAYLTRDISFSENTYPASTVAREENNHGLGLLYGVGFDYNFTEHMAWTTSAVAATPFSFMTDGGTHTIDNPATPTMFLVSTGIKYTF